MDTLTIIYIVLYVLCYLIFFVVKTIRDYIMEYEGLHPARWSNSIWKDKMPVWFQAYLLSDDQAFIATAPKWAVKLMWDSEFNRFKVAIDGWHQLDGIIYLLPHTIMVLFLCHILDIAWYWTILWIFLTPFLFWYQYFNLNFHVWQQKENKQWFRIPKWVRFLFGKRG